MRPAGIILRIARAPSPRICGISRVRTGEAHSPWRLRVLHSIVLATVVCIASSAFAADEWTLTTADFQTQRVSLDSLNNTGLQVITISAAQQAPRRIPLDQFLDLDRAVPAPAAAAMVLYLTGGDRLSGSAIGMKDEQLQWKHPILGEMSIPLRRLATIARSGKVPQRDEDKRTEDVAALVNGDSVRGIVSAISADAVTINSAGQDIAVPFATISTLSFASTTTASQAAPGQRAFRVTLADGSAFTGQKIDLQKSALIITPDNAEPRSVSLASVARIEQLNGPVSWLASRTPIENLQTPYFSSQTQPARMGQTVDGNPVRLGEQTYPHAIGTHAYSRLSFAIDPAYKAFRTRYAIDGSLPYANVTIRIKLDDKVVHEQKDVTAGQQASPVIVDLAGAKQLTLEVDYGKTYDVQDRLNWLEPALLKKSPASAPVSAPSTNP